MYPRARTLAKLDAARFRAEQWHCNAMTPATSIFPSKIRAPDAPYRPPPSPWVPPPKKRWRLRWLSDYVFWAIAWVSRAVRVGLLVGLNFRLWRMAREVVAAVVEEMGIRCEALVHYRLRYRGQLAMKVFLAQTKVRVALVVGGLWMLAVVASHVDDEKREDRVGAVERLYRVGGKAGSVIWTPDRTSGHEGSSSHYREEDWVGQGGWSAVG